MATKFERMIGRKHLVEVKVLSACCVLSWLLIDISVYFLWLAIPSTFVLLPELLAYLSTRTSGNTKLKQLFLRAAIGIDRLLAPIPGTTFDMGLAHRLCLLSIELKSQKDLPGAEIAIREMWEIVNRSPERDLDRVPWLAMLVANLTEQSKKQEAQTILRNLLVEQEKSAQESREHRAKIEGYERSRLRIFLAELNLSANSYEEAAKQLTQAISDAHGCSEQEETTLIAQVWAFSEKLKLAGRLQEYESLVRNLLNLNSVKNNCHKQASFLLLLCEVLTLDKKFRQAECLIEEFLHEHGRNLQPEMAVPLQLATTAMVLALTAQDKYAECEAFIESKLTDCRANGGNLEYEASLLSLLMEVKGQRSDYQAAANIADELVPLVDSIKKTHPANAGKLLTTMCMSYRNIGLWTEALRTAQDSVKLMEESTVADVATARGDLVHLAMAISKLGAIFFGLAQYEDALAAFQRNLALRQKTTSASSFIAQAQSDLGFALIYVCKFEEAEAILLEARSSSEKSYRPEECLTYNIKVNLAHAWLKQGRLDEAQVLLEEIAPGLEGLAPEKGGHRAGEERLMLLGMLFGVRGDFAKSETYFQQSLAKIQEMKPPNARSHSEALAEYAKMLDKAGRVEESKLMQAEAESKQPRLAVPV